MKQITKAKRNIKDFLSGWKELDYQKMYDASQLTWARDRSPENLKALFPFALESGRVLTLKQVSEVTFDFYVMLSIGEESQKVRIRTISEKGAYMPDKDGDFGVNPMSIGRQ